MKDVLIVGGGPAGASAGREAAKRGLSAVLFEKETLPRVKPCGGGLSEAGLDELDEPLPERLKLREVSGLRLVYGSRSLEADAGRRIATMISRAAFDHYLVRRAVDAGVELREGERALGFEERDDRVRLHTNRGIHEGRFLVVAEGSQGRLARLVREPDQKGRYGVAMVAEIPVSLDGLPGGHSKTAPEIYFDAMDGGYGWVFPQGDTCSVGVGTFSRHPPHTRRIFREFLGRCRFPADVPSRGHVIPVGGFDRILRRGRVLLAGDAAGFVDPFSGEGISYALRSGRLAGEAAADALNGSRPVEALLRYERRCRREFEIPFRCSRIVARFFYSFPGFFFRAFDRNEELFQRFFRIPEHAVPYRAFLLWLLPRIPRFFLSTLLPPR
jgi:geranylgeranyl reductase family protein